MSHTVTVTRITTHTVTNRVINNIGFLKTSRGILKLSQLILGIVNVGLASNYYNKNVLFHTTPVTFFLLMAVTFLIGTFLLLLSCLVSRSTSLIISETVYDLIFHGMASILYAAASVTVFVKLDKNEFMYHFYYEEFLAAAIIGLVLALLYAISAFLGYQSYKD